MMNAENLKIEQDNIAKEILSISPGKNGEKPVIDGVIDIEAYIKAPYKILWILKEANFGKSTESWDMLGFYRTTTEAKIKESPTTKRVLLASHRILSDLPAIEAFRSVAYINIKKIAGYEKSIDGEIQNAYNAQKSLLLKQVETYNPDVIICGNTLHYFEHDLDFRQGESISLGMEQRHYFCLKNKLYINAYHPANWQRITDHDYCEKIYKAFSHWREEFRA